MRDFTPDWVRNYVKSEGDDGLGEWERVRGPDSQDQSVEPAPKS